MFLLFILIQREQEGFGEHVVVFDQLEVIGVVVSLCVAKQ